MAHVNPGPDREPPEGGRDEETLLRGLRDVLGRGVMLPTDRLREAIEDAVVRGRMTRDDAEDLLQALIVAGRRQTDDVLSDLEQLLGRSRDVATGARRRTAQGTERVLREVDRARRVAGLGSSFPIRGYDELTAGQIRARLDDLSTAELRQVRDYERKHGNRKTVLSAVERKLG